MTITRTLILSAALMLAGNVAAHTDKPHADKAEKKPEAHLDHSRHQHASWETPPEAYAHKRFAGWADAAAAERGKVIYQAQCASCHGASGVGDGPAGAGLAHKPADLTHHFHRAPGKGDAYLYWRISEGGVVEPFRSQQSAMPPFKSILSEQQRWDVLAYVHQVFHITFKGESDHDDHKGHH